MAPAIRTDELPRGEPWGRWALGLALVQVLGWWLARGRTLIPDEVRPLLVAAGSWGELFDFARQDIVQTPLSYVFHKAWLDLFGHTDAAAKASVLVVGLPTLVLFTAFASRVTRRWRLASLVLLLVLLRVGGSLQLLRMYGLALLFAVVAADAFERWLRTPRGPWLGVWSAAMVLLLYTHASGLLLLGAFVVAGWLHGPRPLALTVAGFAVGASLLPWLLYVQPVFAERGLEANVVALRMSPHRALAELPFQALSTADPGGGSPRPPLHAQAWRRWLEPGARWLHVALFALALPALWRRRPRLLGGSEPSRDPWTWIAGELYLLPIAVLYLFSLLVTPGMSARYFLIETPLWALWLVLLGQAGGAVGRVLVRFVVVPWLVLNVALTAGEHLTRRTVGDVAERVAAELVPGDRVVVNKHMPLGWPFFWEWTRRLGREEPVAIIALPMEPWIASIVPGVSWEELDLAGARRLWYVHEANRRRAIAGKEMARRGWPATREVYREDPALTLFERAP